MSNTFKSISNLSTKNRAFSEVMENPKVDLETGALRLVVPDLSMGKNSYEINVSHVYCSNASGETNAFSAFGKGWKTDMDQRIVTDEGGAYKYIDGTGYVHSFTQYDSAKGKYYDNDDAGIVLTVQANGATVSDDKGNTLTFDNTGKLWKTTSGLNSKIAKLYMCAGDKVAKLCDERDMVAGSPTKYINAIYDNNGLLTAMYVIQNGKKVKGLRYSYSDGYLTAVHALAMNSSGSETASKQIRKYIYSDGKLTYAIDSESDEAIKITYTSGCVSKVSRGVMSSYKNSKGADSQGFIEKTYTSISGNKFTNERGVTTVVSRDTRGRALDRFEDGGSSNLKTLMPLRGIKLSVNGDSADKLNGENARFTSSTVTLTCADMERVGEKDYENYCLSFWVRLKNKSSSRLRAVVKYGGKTEMTMIDHRAVGEWQNVSVPVHAEGDTRKNISFTIGVMDTASIWQSFDIVGARINSGDKPKLMIGGKRFSDSTTWMCTIIAPLDGGIRTLINDFGSTDYLTENDVLRAHTEPVRTGTVGGNQTYDLICNDGTKRIANVTDVKIVVPGQGSYSLFAMYNGATDIKDEVCDKANDIYSETLSPDNKTYMRTYYRPFYIASHTELLVQQEIKISKKGLTTYDEADRIGRKSVWLDGYGRVLKECDSYGAVTQYDYDNDIGDLNYGLLKRTRLYDGNKYLPGSETKYDPTGEYPTATTDGITSSGATYKKPLDLTATVFAGTKSDFDNVSTSYPDEFGYLKTSYTYDAFLRNLVSAKLTCGSFTRNMKYTYEDGGLRKISNDLFTYGIKTDKVNDTVDYTVFDGNNEVSMLTKSATKYNTLKGTSCTKAQYHNTKDAVSSENEMYTDRYGKIESCRYLEDGEQNGGADYFYGSSDGASEAGAQLDYIADGYDGKVYENIYDYNGALVRKKISSSGNKHLGIWQVAAGETRYDLGDNERYKTVVTYDDTMPVDPRIKATAVYADTDGNSTEEWKDQLAFNRNYEYDAIGRTTKITNNGQDIGALIGTLEEDYTYNDNGNVLSPLLAKQTRKRTFGMKKQCDYTNEYEYNERGEISKIHMTASNDANPSVYDITKKYTYDNLGRVLSEYGWSYTYDNYHLTSVKGATNNLTFTYYTSGINKGRLQSQTGAYIDDSLEFKYDNYGNRKETINVGRGGFTVETYEYERGNLLKNVMRRGSLSKYNYNHQGMRVGKFVKDVTTTYYLDGAKILGEDRSDGIKLRYFYDRDGICGMKYTLRDGDPKYYTYIRDIFGSIIGIENSMGQLMCRYEYNALGDWIAHPRSYTDSAFTRECEIIAYLNPFLWKGYYYDTETMFYYISGRYYDPSIGQFIDADDAENIAGGSLDRNAITTGNYLAVDANTFDIFTVDELMPDITYNPNLSFWEKYKTQIVACIMFLVGAALCCFGVLGLGIPLMFGGASMALQYTLLKRFPEYDREINGAFKIINGVFTIVSGVSAIATGIELVGCKAISKVLVGSCFITGLLSVGFGINEAMSGATGKNVIQEWMGGNETLYYGAYLFVNIATVTATAVGQAAMACFIAGTQVVTKEGNKNIEDIQVGDEVLAYDEATGETAYKRVVRLFRNESKEWVGVRVSGEEIISTPNHKYYLPELKSWTEAKKLKSGMKVLLSTGECGIIEATRNIHYDEPQTTYNFEVEDFHTYYVGENGICVHNKCYVELYRAMSNEEYGSLTKHGKFKHKLGTMENKWMATSYEDALEWGNKLMGEGNFRVVKIKVPVSSLKNMYYNNFIDGIGAGYSAYYSYLNAVMISFERVL